MVGERSQLHVIVGIDLHRVAVGSRGVGLAVHHEGLGGLAQVLVHDGVEAALPGGRELAAGLGDRLHVGEEHGVHLGLLRQRGAVIHARHLRVRDDAVVLHHVHHVAAAGAGAEAELAVQADELLRALLVGVGDHVELGEIRILRLVLDVAEADGLGLEEADGGEGPAGAAASLVLDGRDRSGLDRREGIVGLLGCRTLLGRCKDAQAQQSCGEKDGSLHGILIIGF